MAGVGITRFRDVDGVGFGREGRSNVGGRVNSGRRHVGGEKVDDYLLLPSVSQQRVGCVYDDAQPRTKKHSVKPKA